MVHGNPKHKRRTQYFVHRKFQLKYLGSILILVAVLIGVASSTVYFSVFDMLSDKLESVYPQNELQPIMKEANRKLVTNLLLLIPVILAGAMYLSHKIAGPLYRIEKSIQSIIEGKYQFNVKLRKHDEFQELGDSLNDLLKHLQKKNESMQAIAAQLGDYIDKQETTSPSDDAILKKIKTDIDRTLES